MKVFVIEKGIKVVLSNDNGDTKNVICKKDADFGVEDIVIDPIKFYNENYKKLPLKEATQITYYKFRLKKGYHTNSKFTYVTVNDKDVKVLC